MGKITRFCMKNEEKMGDNVFVVCRPSIFGNPYTHIRNKETKALYKVKTRDIAIDLYDKWFDEMVLHDTDFRQHWDALYAAYRQYDEIFLGCFCALNERCHADIIATKLKKRAAKEMLDSLRAKDKETDNNA